MTHLHIREKEQFKKLFTQEMIDRFEDRFKVLEIFLKIERHITVEELVGRIRDAGGSLDPAFVAETLELMCRFGFAAKNAFDNGEVLYEHRHLGQHHDHMICTKCRNVIEFNDEQLENLQIQIAATHGFHMLQHKMEIYGICSECLKERVPLIPLSAAKQGEHLIIRELSGGATAKMRLMTMGLRVGDELEIITNRERGQVVVAADYKRYVLGRGLAQKIMAEPCRASGRR